MLSPVETPVLEASAKLKSKSNIQPTNSIHEFRTPTINPSSTSTSGRKRTIIDLTIDDEDENQDVHAIGRKKSRTSSQSSDAQFQTRADRYDTQPDRIGRINEGESESGDSVDSAASILSNKYPTSSSAYVSAVVVPQSRPSLSENLRLFRQNLQILGTGVTVRNDIDNTSPPTSFRFVRESILGSGVTRVTEDVMYGCTCRKDNGRNIGCEYLDCGCLADSAETEHGKKVFPYSAGRDDYGCLRTFYLENRHHIYECNRLCNCERNCKNRVVQHGRTVPLEIFKTTNRGWGLRSTQDLKKGQFIDTYRGEIITNDEANRRSGTMEKDIYLMDLDKWTEEEGAAQYVCDGKHVGGPTRFINHSCDPNCAIYTVSYNHADINIYDLAFFATEFIPRGTELTFDYVGEEDHTPITEKKADEIAEEKGYRPAKCFCGASICRGYFFN